MRVLTPRLLAVLDPEQASRPSRRVGQGASQPSGPQPSPIGSARSNGSARVAPPSSAPGAATGRTGAQEPLLRPPGGNGAQGAIGLKELEVDDCSPFDLLHTERGFQAFEQWYRRLMASGAAAAAAPAPRPELGLLWPQAYCPASGLHEYAFAELLKIFAECTEGEALDFFDLLDHDFHGSLGLPQVYIAICLMAALGCRQLTKFLFFHSTRLFGILARGCRHSAAPSRVTWARLLVLLRLLGVPGHVLSTVGVELTPLTQLEYEEFVDLMFPIMVQLDRGADIGESTVINESDRPGNMRSKMCTLL